MSAVTSRLFSYVILIHKNCRLKIESHLVAKKKNIPKTYNVDPDHLAGAQLQILHFICKRNSGYSFWSPSFR